jgi:membrane-bound lytic murein transglycosylase MltF
MRHLVDARFTGDLDQIIRRRVIRVGVPFNRTFYFIDKGVQRGISYEYLVMLEDYLNKQFNTGNMRVYMVPVPMAHDMLIPQLRAGRIDAVVAQMTVTPERQKVVDFTIPTRTNVDEIVVTGPGSPSLKTIDNLSGAHVFVRKSSSYYASLQALNSRLRTNGKPPIKIEEAPENLEDDDLLEMVNAGLLPATVVDNYLAQYWIKVLPNLQLHNDLKLRTGGTLAVAYRQNNPRLGEELNGFIQKNGLNSAFGRAIQKRYLQDTKFITAASSTQDRQRFQRTVDIFKKYGELYSFDYLMMAAQGYQESRLDQNAHSQVGAVGVMQLMPATGQQLGVGDIHQIDSNIHAGVKYMRLLRDKQFADQPMDDLNKELFTFAAYNCGAGRVHQLRVEAAARGLNPNVWFGNVEQIASVGLCGAPHNPTYVSGEIMWRRRPDAQHGWGKSGLLRHIIIRCSPAAAGQRRSVGSVRFGRRRRPPSRGPSASSQHPRRRSGGLWRPGHGRARPGSSGGPRPTGEASSRESAGKCAAIWTCPLSWA